jgi:hypothetical protein
MKLNINVQEALSEWRVIINEEKLAAKTEKRESVINEDFEKLLIVAETQNMCIKILKNGKSFKELESWIIEPNELLDNQSPIEAIENGEVDRVYSII